jgi:hypothetical protein
MKTEQEIKAEIERITKKICEIERCNPNNMIAIDLKVRRNALRWVIGEY